MNPINGQKNGLEFPVEWAGKPYARTYTIQSESREWVSGNPGQEGGPLCEKSNVFGRQGLVRPLCWSKLYGFDA